MRRYICTCTDTQTQMHTSFFLQPSCDILDFKTGELGTSYDPSEQLRSSPYAFRLA